MTTETRITEKALCMAVSFRGWGVNRKTGITPDAETGADKALLSTSKKILDAPEYVAIGAANGVIKKMLNKLCVPFPLQRAVWLVPVALLPKVEEELEAGVARRKEAVEALVEAMPRLREELRERLADLYDESQYPSGEELRRMFRVETAYVSLDVPGALGQIDKALFENERRKAETRWAEATEEIRVAMREAFAGLVRRMAEQLTTKEDGTRRKFYDSSVENLREFIDLFAARNLAGDDDLTALVEQARSLVGGEVSAAQFRKDASLRTEIKARVDAVAAKVETLVCDQPKRRFAFDEE